MSRHPNPIRLPLLVTGVAGEKYSLGYFGYAYYIDNKDQLKALAIAP